MNTVLEELEPIQTLTEDVLFSVGSAGLSICRPSSLPTLYKVRHYLCHKIFPPPKPNIQEIGLQVFMGTSGSKFGSAATSEEHQTKQLQGSCLPTWSLASPITEPTSESTMYRSKRRARCAPTLNSELIAA